MAALAALLLASQSTFALIMMPRTPANSRTSRVDALSMLSPPEGESSGDGFLPERNVRISLAASALAILPPRLRSSPAIPIPLQLTLCQVDWDSEWRTELQRRESGTTTWRPEGREPPSKQELTEAQLKLAVRTQPYLPTATTLQAQLSLSDQSVFTPSRHHQRPQPLVSTLTTAWIAGAQSDSAGVTLNQLTGDWRFWSDYSALNPRGRVGPQGHMGCARMVCPDGSG